MKIDIVSRGLNQGYLIIKKNWILSIFASLFILVFIVSFPAYSTYRNAERVSGAIKYIELRNTGFGSRQIIVISGRRFDCFVYLISFAGRAVCPQPSNVSEGVHLEIEIMHPFFMSADYPKVIASSANSNFENKLSYSALLINHIFKFSLVLAFYFFLNWLAYISNTKPPNN